MSIKTRLFLFILLFTPYWAACRPPPLTSTSVKQKVQEILKAHASYKTLNEELVKRMLYNFLDELDPTKTYLIEPDVLEWIQPSDILITQVLSEYNQGHFTVFERIHKKMISAIERRRQLDQKINTSTLPTHVSAKEFKNMQWAKSEEELFNRLLRIRSLQLETAKKLNGEMQVTALARIAKHQAKHEEELLVIEDIQHERLILTMVLKAFASAVDSHTAYFTPEEATAFMINVQQRLFGIGAQLRDNLNGFTIVKIIEGGPAAIGKELKVKDRIVAVNGEPVVGMHIEDGVELIRGPENTPVTLTIIRESRENETTHEEKKEVVVMRGEVVLKESRYQISYEPFGEGVIAHIRLNGFYQDQDNSSANDLTKEIKKLRQEHQLKGVILDLRYNTGGLLTQAVEVAGLFITKGIIVSIKDNTGSVQHLRDLDGLTIWDGPLIVLVNRASASASEIVAQALQDYGRALIVGDDHTYGKGSFQVFTLHTGKDAKVNPEGEYKVTKGRYYTVSGKTPQLVGVSSDIVVPGILSESEVGERYAKYPLMNDKIKQNFDDDLLDVPFMQRDKIRLLYKFNLQQQLSTYTPYVNKLKANSKHRIDQDKNYQNFFKELKKEEMRDEELGEEESRDQFGQNDLQLTETYNIMKDLVLLMHCDGKIF